MVFLVEAIQTVRTYLLPLLAVLFIARLARNRYKAVLRDIPGPFLASLSDIWQLVHCYRGESRHEYLLHRKYGSSLLRLGPNKISVADPEAIRVIYGYKPVFAKSQLYTTQGQMSPSGYLVDNLASTMDNETHARMLRPVAGAYAMSTLVDFEPLVDSTSKMFMEQMKNRFADRGKDCALDKWLQMYAFDVIGELTFSKRIGFLETGQDVEQMMYHTKRALDYTGIIGQMPSLDWYFRIKNPILHMLRPTSNILSFTMKQIHEHESYSDAARPDFLTRFLQARDKYPDSIDEERVRDYANTNVSGGSDTTAVGLRTLVYELLNNPAIYARFMEELKAILEQRNDVESNDKPITWAESLKMTYFQACIKEALRYCPAAAQILPRIVPEGGVELCGKRLPAGTVVGCNAWTVHRDKDLYGSDADVFRPERWLDTTSEQVRKMDSLLFTFGAGSRSCIGKNIAMLEMCKFVPELFRRFEMRLVDPNRYKIRSTWLIFQSGLDVKMRWRNSQSPLD